MRRSRSTIRAALILATGCWSVFVAGCGAALRAELTASRLLDTAAAGIEPSLRDYHRELTAGLDAEEGRTIDEFVERLRDDVGDASAGDAHAARFEASLERLRRQRMDEDDRYRSALDKLDALRATAARLHESAVARSGLLGMLGELLRGLVASLDSMWPPAPVEPRE